MLAALPRNPDGAHPARAIVGGIVLVGLALLATACGGDGDEVRSDRCLVRLHGKGSSGTDPVLDGTVAVLAPDGNGEGWGDREWRYETTDELRAATSIVRDTIDAAGCERIAVQGFSNGGAFAVALLCAGESFGGRLVGVVVDDPVTDAASADCRPADGVEVVLYWTGALDEIAPAGTVCAELDWTCSGPVIRGVAAIAADLGIDVTASPLTDHTSYVDAPEPSRWLAAPVGA
jgi:pimeloyl-ACP methyl ester carboxylesterase